MRRVCFYHAGCPDGFGAAWAVWKAWGDGGEYRARGHDDVVRGPELAGALVVFVDNAPANPALRQLADHAGQVIVLDHHVTALERFEADPELGPSLAARGHRVHFDLTRSGAVLAWEHFHRGEPLPPLLGYVQDQDLWRWALPDSDAVNAALYSYPRRFDVWEQLAARPIEELVDEGRSIARSQRVEVERALHQAHAITLGGLRLDAVNALYHRALIGHELALRKSHGHPAGAVYRVTGRRVDCSLYSIGDFDVAKIAARYGGGGHRNAAGFHVPLQEWIDRFVT